MKAFSLDKALENPKEITHLSIQYRNLNPGFPIDILSFSRLVELELTNTLLTTLPENLLILTKLQKLNLRGNQIQNIPEVIYQIKQLTHLNLSSNSLTKFPELSHNPKLISLHLEENDIQELPESISTNKIEELNLMKTNLTKLPKSIGQFRQLKDLKLNFNALTRLVTDLSKCKKLQKLRISNNKLKTLPRSIKNLIDLEYLNARENQINQIPAEIGACKQIIYLDFYKNKLKELPDEFCQLTKVRQLQLAKNKLIKLPKDFGNLKNISELLLFDNQLTELPESIGNIPFLYNLKLDNNKLQKLPDHFCNLSHLTHLHLSKNQLTKLPENIGNLSSLKTLDLSYNQLTSLPKSLGQITTITNINLYGNPIQYFPKELLQFSKLMILRGLKGVLSIAQKNQLLSFLKRCKKQNINKEYREPYYDLLTKKPDQLDNYPLELLLSALQFSMEEVKQNARYLIVKNHGIPIEESPLNKGAVVSFHGKTNLKIRETSEKLKAFGIRFSKKIIPETTHIVIGYAAVEFNHLLSRPFVFLTEQSLNDFIWNSKSSQFNFDIDDNSLENLARLLTSNQDTNIKLALQIIKNIGFDKSIITELFLAYKFVKSSTLKREIKKILTLNANAETLHAIQFRGALRGYISEQEIKSNIVYFTTNSQLDGRKIAQFLIEHFQKGRLYLESLE